jgi:hypothetical protein
MARCATWVTERKRKRLRPDRDRRYGFACSAVSARCLTFAWQRVCLKATVLA